jgi:hypothetical protein
LRQGVAPTQETRSAGGGAMPLLNVVFATFLVILSRRVPPMPVQHMVLLKFKPGVPQATVNELFDQLSGLQERIAGITYFAGGPYASDEGLNAGYTHGFLMTFESPASRDTYLPHPEHERVKAAILPHLESVIAFDFEA